MKKQLKIINKKSKKENPPKEEKITTSEKKDIKGGTLKFKEQLKNQNKQNKGPKRTTPLRAIKFRECLNSYKKVIKKNIKGETKP